MSQNYRVLAIRHRPKQLSDLFGQDTAVRSIQGFFKSGNIPQTLLISGPYGSGKTTMARIIARYANCQNPTKVEGYAFGEPCNKCWSCVELDKIDPNHPDVHEINAAEERGIDAVRSWVQQSKYKPKGNFRVFIIDEVHAITGEAASAFLKPLEEPSRATIWILCTTEPGRLLSTARSRAVPIKVNSVSLEDCAKLLASVVEKEGFVVPDADRALMKVAAAARGHPREALQILESVINVVSGVDTASVDITQIVSDAADEIVGEGTDVQACKYLFAVYRGKYTIPLATLPLVTNPQLFLDTVLRYHIQTTRYTVSGTLLDKYYSDYYAKLVGEKILSQFNLPKHKSTVDRYIILRPELLSAMTETFFEALTQLKQYLVDPYLILFRMTTKVVTQVKADPSSGVIVNILPEDSIENDQSKKG